MDSDKAKVWDPLSFVPGLGSVIGAVDAFVGLFSDKKTETMPVAYNLSWTAEGTIITPDEQRSIFMDVPSASVSLIPDTEVKWNNTLGVFALLEAPMFSYRKVGTVNVCPPEFDWDSNCYRDVSDITLNKDLKFAINSASYALSSNYDIQVALESGSKRTAYRDYSCSSTQAYRLEEIENDRFGSVYLRVVVTFNKTTIDGTLNEAVFSARYRAYPGSSSGDCSSVTRYAADVEAVCSTNEYQDRTEQYLRTGPTDDKEIIAERDANESNFTVFPNPSAGRVDFEYTLMASGYVSLTIVDLSGREVVKAINNQFYSEGTHRAQIDLQQERKVAPGVYLCRMQSDEGEKVQRLVVQ